MTLTAPRRSKPNAVAHITLSIKRQDLWESPPSRCAFRIPSRKATAPSTNVPAFARATIRRWLAGGESGPIQINTAGSFCLQQASDRVDGIGLREATGESRTARSPGIGNDHASKLALSVSTNATSIADWIHSLRPGMVGLGSSGIKRGWVRCRRLRWRGSGNGG